jgi:hypothetical protein
LHGIAKLSRQEEPETPGLRGAGLASPDIWIALLLAFDRPPRRFVQIRHRFPLSAAGRTPPFIDDA